MARPRQAGRRPYDQQLEARGARLAWRVNERVPFCWMCDRTQGRRAREHIFPKWLLVELGAVDELFHPTHADVFGRRISSRGPVPASAFVAGEVCDVCNAGWMSDLEALVRPILFPPGGRETLSSTDQEVLARWLIKVAVVLNTSQNYRLMIPRAARHAVAHGVPPDFGVYIAEHRQESGKLNFAQTTGAMSIVPSGRETGYQREAAKVYGCALAIDDFLAVVVYARPGAWAMPTEPMTRIWPTPAPAKWTELPAVEEIWAPLLLGGQHPRFTLDGSARAETWEAIARGELPPR